MGSPSFVCTVFPVTSQPMVVTCSPTWAWRCLALTKSNPFKIHVYRSTGWREMRRPRVLNSCLSMRVFGQGGCFTGGRRAGVENRLLLTEPNFPDKVFTRSAGFSSIEAYSLCSIYIFMAKEVLCKTYEREEPLSHFSQNLCSLHAPGNTWGFSLFP